MKYLKVIVPLLVVIAILVIVLPVGAQGPRPVMVRAAGANEDPFGGFPIGTSSGLGAFSRVGAGGPGNFLTPGGVPSDKSGDGSSPRKSIYLGGAWADNSVNPRLVGGWDYAPASMQQVGGRASNENPYEIPSCSTLTIPAGTSRWFKLDTWKNKKLQVWLDDELNGATKPSGAAVWGAANMYMWGLNNESNWVYYGWDIYPWSQGLIGNPILEGFVMAIYDPDNMRPNYAYNPPNATLYTLVASGSGGLRRSGQGLNTAGGQDPRGVSGTGIIYPDFGPGFASNIHGYGSFDPHQPSHLLFYEAVFDGWVHVRVYNQMIWDGAATVCSYRAYRN